ncbi:MAG TPA: helix-turn-helix domain-containing protein [Roseiflexaceae bacterium]|nr:helix-turn-helix domain-containing protein [Roseiflexaceae bacterium]
MDGEHSFGAWVRRRRKALGLTQAELARRVGVAAITVQKIEADERRPSPPVAGLLARHLALPEAESAAFVRAARGELAVDRLPPAQPTAPAARAIGIADSAGTPPRERLIAWLWTRRLLLLLDNFEHLLEAAPLVGDILRAAPGVTALVTSRAPLHLSGEREYPVGPLGLPPKTFLRSWVGVPSSAGYDSQYQHGRAEVGAVDVGRWSFVVDQSPAVQLFVERAQAVRPTFALTDETALAVAAICARLDGLPLAIELAAARVKLFAPAALLARLEAGGVLSQLTGGPRDLPARQRTVRDTIAWSYELLSAEEQALFRRLGVFVGGCTLAAASAVVSAEFSVLSSGSDNSALTTQNVALEVLASLVDHSLVRTVDGVGDEPRFALLETVREFALEQLAETAELEEARRRHAEYFVALAEEAEAQLIGPEQIAWLERLELEIPNLRAAVARGAEHQRWTLVARLCIGLYQFWLVRRSYILEGIGWLDGVLAYRDTLPKPLHAWALFTAGELLSRVGDHDRAKLLVAESLAQFRHLKDERGMAAALVRIGAYEGDRMRATALFEESLALARASGDRARSEEPIRDRQLPYLPGKDRARTRK